MATLYIIGNGFDIAHGLDTSYWNFRSYLEMRDYEFLLSFEKMYDIEPLDETEYGYTIDAQKKWEKHIKEILWSEFERCMGNPNIQSMLDFSSSILDDLNLETGNVGIFDTMNDYWRAEFGFVKKLQTYVREWIAQIDLSNTLPKCEELFNNNKDFYLNYNYTRVLEDVYKIDDVLHIHGSIGDNFDMAPFMGHCNKEEIDIHKQQYEEAYESNCEGEASIRKAITEYLSEIYKDTSHYISIHKDFFEKLVSINEIKIIGWSAGEVDIPYLNKIRDSIPKKTKWTVYYYDDKAYNNLQKAFKENNIIDNFETEFLLSTSFWNV